VLLNGRNIRDDLAGFKQRLGYVPEEPILDSYMTGLEYLQLIGRLRCLSASLVERKSNAFFCASRPIPRILSLQRRDYASQVQERLDDRIPVITSEIMDIRVIHQN
jgi:hypothetical protein